MIKNLIKAARGVVDHFDPDKKDFWQRFPSTYDVLAQGKLSALRLALRPLDNEAAFDRLLGGEIELDVTDNPNWDLEIPLVMGAVERGALAHRIRAWGAQQFAAGKAAALAELHPHYEVEKQRADRLQARANEAAFDKLLSDEPPKRMTVDLGESKAPPGAITDALGRCGHQFECDQLGYGYSIWRCSKCGVERVR